VAVSRTSLASRTVFEVVGLGLESQVLGLDLGLETSRSSKIGLSSVEVFLEKLLPVLRLLLFLSRHKNKISRLLLHIYLFKTDDCWISNPTVSGFFVAILTLKWKRGAVKNTCFAVPGESKWDGRPMAHADLRGILTYFAVFKMMISSKNMNQNMLKIPYFFEKFVNIRQALEGRFQISVSLHRQTPLLRVTLPTPTVLQQNVLSLSPFLIKVLRRKFYWSYFFWRTHYTFGNILFWTFGQILPPPKLFCSPTAMIQPHL